VRTPAEACYMCVRERERERESEKEREREREREKERERERSGNCREAVSLFLYCTM